MTKGSTDVPTKEELARFFLEAQHPATNAWGGAGPTARAPG